MVARVGPVPRRANPRKYRGSLPSVSRGPPPERDLAHRASEQRRRAQLHDVRELRQISQLRRGGCLFFFSVLFFLVWFILGLRYYMFMGLLRYFERYWNLYN